MPTTQAVAVKYYQTIPHTMRVGGVDYVFSVRHNICLAWVEPQHVQSLLTATKTCCGGHKNTGIYKLASETDVARWSGERER